MRNLKRALSLTLASVMLLGMMVIGTSAASYPDVDENDNVEAIEVLQAVGVMQGDDKGNFDPDRSVSRNEMAIVMAKLLNLDYNYYSASCPFYDVPDYAKPYVGACFANGIVSGYSANVYGGADTVTAVQAASMMMRALGYFQYDSDYKDGFVTATVKQASKLGLFADINANQDTPLTRNQVAQLALNTLETAVVDAEDNTLNISGSSGGMSMSVSGGQVNYIVRTSSEKFAQAINSTDLGDTTTSGRRGFTVELGEQLYNGDLKKDEDVRDDFGRPAVRWAHKSNEIGVYANKGDLVESWNKKVTKDMVYKTLGGGLVDDLKATSLPTGVEAKLSYYKDGVLDASANGTHVSAAVVAKFADRNNTGKIDDDKDTGNGSWTEMHVDDKSNVTIVVIDTYVFQAASDFNSSTGELKVSAAGDTSEYIRLDNYTLKDEDFALADIKEDDYLLITVADTDTDGKYEPQSVQVAELVTGKVEAYALRDSVTVDGQDYSYSLMTEKDGVKDEVQSTGGNVALVLDKYGYVIAVDDTVVGGSYVFITEANNEGNLSNSNIVASAYFSDGTDGTITLKKVDGSTNKTTMKGAKGWYSYSQDSDGKYTLTSPRGSYRGGYNLQVAYNDPALNNNKLLTNGSAKLYEIEGATGTAANGATNVRANEKTIFVVVDKDGDVYSYTGVSNAPDIEVTAGKYQVGYVWNDKTEYATYVFISTENNTNSSVDSASEADEYIYLTKLDKTRDNGTDTYYVYKAIKDGKETTVETDDNSYPVMRLYSKVKYDSKTNRITSMKEVVGDGETSDFVFATDKKWHKEGTLSNAQISFKGDVLTIGTRSFTIKDSQLNLVVMKDAGISDLKINSDKDADYVVYADETGASLRAILDGFSVSGHYYVVTEKDYSGSAYNDQWINYLFLYVDTAADGHGQNEDAAKTALEALDDAVIGVGKNNGESWTKPTFKAYVANEIAKVTKNVSVSVDYDDATWAAPVDGADKDHVTGTDGTYGPVKVTIKKNDGTDQVVTLNFTVGAKPYTLTDPEIINKAKTDVPTAMAAGVGDGETEDLTDEDAAKQAVKEKVIASLPEGVTVNASTRTFEAGWEFGEFTKPVNGTKESVNGTDGKFATVKVQIIKDKAEGVIEMTDVKVKAVAFACDHKTTVKTEAKAATCAATGNTAYWTCSGCDKLFSDEACTTETTLKDVTIDKLTTHTKGNTPSYTQGTDESGTGGDDHSSQHSYTCDVCSETIWEACDISSGTCVCGRT